MEEAERALQLRRLMERVDVDGPVSILTGTPCWIWTGKARTRRGYGRMEVMGEKLAHRVSYRLHVGDIPEDSPILRHRCDNPPCVRPDHLLPGTQADNAADREERGRGVRMRGESNSSCKLDAERILRVVSAVESGRSMRSVAREFGVTHRVVGRIARGESWAHVDRQAGAELPTD